ncbi:hypothetical protein NLU13_8820 [Sarocladium strictum]|uniref:endo-polygalacturonase n=1 Tax=Sarocladium strictum TaxID=5046 RepID=A0AA39G9J5_SARSR|nr:hypothetical protein NLU13_8820 [Sarocladium strictum]
MLSNALLLGALASTGLASPTWEQEAGIEPRGVSCTFNTLAQVLQGKSTCDTITLDNINVPAGQTLDLTGLKSGCNLIFSGNTSFGYTPWTGPLIAISGQNVAVQGADGHIIDCQGQRWWDGKGANGGKKKPKRALFKERKKDGSKESQSRRRPVELTPFLQSLNVTLDAQDGDKLGGHNTDGFDIGNAQNIYIYGATVKNQDDCMAINSGTNITFTEGSCSGGHGLSIGSVGLRSNNNVSDVHITNSVVSNSDNGVRIKTIVDATGSVDGVVYDNITLQNIAKMGIVIEQDYQNGNATGHPTGGVPITNVTLNDITGNVLPNGANVYILCAAGACSDWVWNDVDVTGGQKPKSCMNVPSPAVCS